MNKSNVFQYLLNKKSNLLHICIFVILSTCSQTLYAATKKNKNVASAEKVAPAQSNNALTSEQYAEVDSGESSTILVSKKNEVIVPVEFDTTLMEDDEIISTNEPKKTEFNPSNFYIGVGVGMQWGRTTWKMNFTGITNDTIKFNVKFLASITAGYVSQHGKFRMPIEFVYSYIVDSVDLGKYPLKAQDGGNTAASDANFGIGLQMVYGVRIKPGFMINDKLSLHALLGLIGGVFEQKMEFGSVAVKNGISNPGATSSGLLTHMPGIEGGIGAEYRINANLSAALYFSYLRFLGSKKQLDSLTDSASTNDMAKRAYGEVNLSYNLFTYGLHYVQATFSLIYYPFAT